MDPDDSDSEWESISSGDSDQTETTEEQSTSSDEQLPQYTPDASSDSGSDATSQTSSEADAARSPTSASLSSTQVDSLEYSLYSRTDFSANTSQLDVRSRSDVSDATRDIKCDIFAKWLHTKQMEKMWNGGNPGEGVFVKKSKGNYAYAPTTLILDGADIYHGIVELNVRCAMTVSSSIINYILDRADQSYIQIRSGLRLQIIPSCKALAHCQRGQSAAFVASHRILVVWQDDPKLLLKRAQYLQDALAKFIVGDEFGDDDEKGFGKAPINDSVKDDDSLEKEVDGDEERRETKLWQSAYTAITVLALTAALGTGWRQVAIEQYQNPNLLRLLFIVCLPAQAWLSLFFFQAMIGNFALMFGSTGGMYENSKYYSGKPPPRLRRDTYGATLPHVTIQMPVYKEGLHGVIEPTVQSIKQAISTYELQGGTANIFINDDGMQIISAEEAEERQEFYDENGIGWVARPRHVPTGPKRFIRRGKFKKASNMNYALRLSVRVEDLLNEIERGIEWTQIEETAAYQMALHIALAEREGEAWADGSIRIGDYILLIDSDTRVPKDCLIDAVSEMEQSPQVAILQYSSGVMNVTRSFFENGITFFTNMIYTMIRFAVANGDVAPFVGHNAVLRWSALQEVAYDCELDQWEKYWSENTVSEDFDMALRLQSVGYLVRLAAYKKDGYKEGVSLTVYDELARWEKYAYGCSELIFHPFRDWIFKGPFTNLFITFMFSNMPLSSKITIMAYVGTYFALGSAWVLTVLNYFLIGFFNGQLDHYYIDSFRVYFAIIVVFTVLGNLGLAYFRYRIGEGKLLTGVLLNMKWIPLITIFLGGVSLHLSQALFCHLFSIDMEWGSTTKEARDVPFVDAINHVLTRFKWNFLFCAVGTAVMVCCRFLPGEDWQIRLLVAIWPMAALIVNHFLLPIVLNPELMRVNW